MVEDRAQIVRDIASFQKRVVSSETCLRDTPQGSHYAGNPLDHGLKKLKVSHPRSLFAAMTMKETKTPPSDYGFEFFFVCWVKFI